jgi:hypothetical protein
VGTQDLARPRGLPAAKCSHLGGKHATPALQQGLQARQQPRGVPRHLGMLSRSGVAVALPLCGGRAALVVVVLLRRLAHLLLLVLLLLLLAQEAHCGAHGHTGLACKQQVCCDRHSLQQCECQAKALVITTGDSSQQAGRQGHQLLQQQRARELPAAAGAAACSCR